MLGSFAVVAVPANYRIRGVTTFMVSCGGVDYQKNLGPDSINIVEKVEIHKVREFSNQEPAKAK